MKIWHLPATLILLVGTSGIGYATSWTDIVKLKGDFRYRHELSKEKEEEPRNRHRIRARIAVETKPNQAIKTVFRIVTGSNDPRSTMQSLDGGFSDKSWMLDLAYFDAALPAFQNAHLLGGKMPCPFLSTSLVWDQDVTPEGLALSFAHPHGTTEPLANVGFFWIEERADDDDSYLLVGQGGMRIKPEGGPISFAVCGGVSQYTEAKGRPTFYDPARSLGNSVDTLGHYSTDFTQIEGYVEMATTVAGTPVKVLGNYVKNTGADSLGQGFLAGMAIGKAKKVNSWEFKYNYRRLEKDAVIAAFTDSDPWAGGGTDGECHKFQGGYEIAEKTQVTLIYFLAKNGLDRGNDYQKFRAELDVKF